MVTFLIIVEKKACGKGFCAVEVILGISYLMFNFVFTKR